MKQSGIQKINSIGIRLALVVAVFFWGICFGALEARAAVYRVKFDAGGSNNGSSWENAFTLLQSALDAASTGDEIWVAAGTYFPSDDYGLGIGDRGRHFEMKNGVGIFGGFAGTETARDQRNWETNETILSGDIGTEGNASDNCYHVFYNPSNLNLDNSAVIDGFTVTGGYADYDHGQGAGGGGFYNHVSPVTISNCVIRDNHARGIGIAAYGGGIYNYYSDAIITDCVFENNSSNYYGGGMSDLSSSPTVTNCRFESNSASNYGGGILSYYYSNPTITNCDFIGNISQAGGGIYIYNYSDAQVANCKFIGNSAEEYGGGMAIDDSNAQAASEIVVTNCLFSGNSSPYSGGMDITSSTAQLINCTFSGNSADYGGGIAFWVSDASAIKNTIIWDNNATEEGPEIDIFSRSNPTFSYCDIKGSGGSGALWNTAMGSDGGGNIDDPESPFADAALHLLPGSNCINTGDNSAVPLSITTDLDGNARIVEATVDMGAYEYYLAAPAAAIPTLTEWGMLILFCGLGIGAVRTLKNKRSRNAAI